MIMSRVRLALACLAAIACIAPNASAAPSSPLSHAGRWITDARGRVVILHGANMVYKVAPFYPSAAGFDDDDAAFLERMGFNAVRVGVIWSALEPAPGRYDDGYLAQIASTVATLARHRIFSLLDFHQDMYNELFQGEGFPNWAVQDDGLPAIPRLGFAQNYETMLALWRAYDHFWENTAGPGGVGLQDRYAAAWHHVAERFRDSRNVLGYELMNEPFPGTPWLGCAVLTGCPVFDATLTAFYRRVDAAIRTVDRQTLIFYEPNILFDHGPGTSVGPIGDPRAGFSFHDYCFEQGIFRTSLSCTASSELVVSNALAQVRRTGDALLMSEFGDQDYALMSAMVRRDDRYMIPWLEWSYCPCRDPTGAASVNAFIRNPASPPTGSNLNLRALRILVEPYPQLIAGTPLSWGFVPTAGTFTFSYTTARASGHGSFGAGSISQIATPRFVYGNGYSVVASGGAIVSRRGAQTLRIAACRAARTITVTVNPISGSAPRWAWDEGSCRSPARAGRHPGSH
jgi:endoglycosylceramidase